MGATLGGLHRRTHVELAMDLLYNLSRWPDCRRARMGNYGATPNHQEKADTVELDSGLEFHHGRSAVAMDDRARRAANEWFRVRFVTSLAVISGVSYHLVGTSSEGRSRDQFRALKSRQIAPGVADGPARVFAMFGSVFVIPVLLPPRAARFTANQTGLVIFPARASAITHGVLGRLRAGSTRAHSSRSGARSLLVHCGDVRNSRFDSGAERTCSGPLVARGRRPGLISFRSPAHSTHQWAG